MPTNTPKPPPLPRQDSPSPSVYNVVTDIATGPNVRKKDNLYQAVFILCCVPPPIVAFWLAGQPWLTCLLFGGLIGLVVGVLLSGGFLMVYRLFRH